MMLQKKTRLIRFRWKLVLIAILFIPLVQVQAMCTGMQDDIKNVINNSNNIKTEVTDAVLKYIPLGMVKTNAINCLRSEGFIVRTTNVSGADETIVGSIKIERDLLGYKEVRIVIKVRLDLVDKLNTFVFQHSL